MQLARNLFLSPDRNFRRKMQEVMLSIQIERRFTKPQIFTLYANQIYLGHGVYGFEAGANYYFSKKAKDLTLEEAAYWPVCPRRRITIRPSTIPSAPCAAATWSSTTCWRMARSPPPKPLRAKDTPLQLKLAAEPNDIAPYYIEEIRQYLEKKYGAEQVHEGGLRVYTGAEFGDAACRTAGVTRRPRRL